MQTDNKPTMYMEFSNPGEVPLNAFKLLGASTKRNVDGKIGFFGTGLKYAVALMLREQIPFKAYIGTKEVKFGVRQTTFGDVKVQVITVNNEKTSMTTDAGIDWEPWFAIREIYSNALDEGGSMELSSEFKPEAGKTKIYVEMNTKLGDVSKNWQSYFTMKRRPLEEIFINKGKSSERYYRILPKREGQNEFRIFRRGILVGRARNVDSLFDYDVSDIIINESRVVKHDYQGRQRAAEALAQATNRDIVELFVKSWKQPVLEHEERFWEYLFDEYWFSGDKFSQTWLEVLRPYRLVPSDNTGFYGVTSNTVGLPNRMLKYLYQQFKDELTIEGMSKTHYIVTGVFPVQLINAMQILAKAGYSFDCNKIKQGRFRDFDIKACWDREAGQIIVSDDILNMPEDGKVAVMLEEIIHAKTGYSDHTRQFQDYVLSELTSRIMDSNE